MDRYIDCAVLVGDWILVVLLRCNEDLEGDTVLRVKLREFGEFDCGLTGDRMGPCCL